jgi:hypothetical protein
MKQKVTQIYNRYTIKVVDLDKENGKISIDRLHPTKYNPTHDGCKWSAHKH